MIHPAIDKDYPAGVAAYRQLVAGARPVFRANHYDLYRREGFDHLYFRGLALRHSNGETGKYETFTYEATPALLAWASGNVTRTFDELIAKAGIDAKTAIRNLRRRLRYQDVTPRAFPNIRNSLAAPTTVNEDGDFSSPGLTDWYVQEFCKLNGLKP